jgi:beta-glucosidase
VANMTLEEKVNVTIGVSQQQNGCVGVSGSVPRLNFSGFCLQDGPAGVRTTDLVSGFPAQIHLGATWNESLVYDVAKYMGAEFKAKGGKPFLDQEPTCKAFANGDSKLMLRWAL